MPTATFRFYAELNDLIPERRRRVDFEAPFKDKRSIKDMIESLGVPHTEVDLILVNGQSVDFGYILEDGDRVSVYPVFESLNIKYASHLRQIPLRRTRFIADTGLRDIAGLMRTLGFDVYFKSGLSNREIIDISNREQRIILTRSRDLLKFRDVTHGILVRPASRPEQVRRIIESLDIRDQAEPFTRCSQCNGLLKQVRKEDVLDRIPPRTSECCTEYFICESCAHLYWKGTHVAGMKRIVDQILG